MQIFTLQHTQHWLDVARKTLNTWITQLQDLGNKLLEFTLTKRLGAIRVGTDFWSSGKCTATQLTRKPNLANYKQGVCSWGKGAAVIATDNKQLGFSDSWKGCVNAAGKTSMCGIDVCAGSNSELCGPVYYETVKASYKSVVDQVVFSTIKEMKLLLEQLPTKLPASAQAPLAPSAPRAAPASSGCPGGALRACIKLCPVTIPKVYQACVQNCGEVC